MIYWGAQAIWVPYAEVQASCGPAFNKMSQIA